MHVFHLGLQLFIDKFHSSTMLFLLISFFSLLLLSSKSLIKTKHKFRFSRICSPSIKTYNISTNHEGIICLLDLPVFALENILETLSPEELHKVSRVCSFLREICTSDHLWEKYMKKKWGGVIGHFAYNEWKLHIASKEMKERKSDLGRSLPVNSIMCFYLALETGKFWFLAQVFNRENGHIGFMLSCHDAKLSYDLTTNNFVARYSCHGKHMIESDVEWNRIRARNVDTPANVLHISDCLDELKPDDHIEIQWRRNKDSPYGWLYGGVGHLGSCCVDEINCQCHISDIVILEFKQYNIGSQWRKMTIKRNEYKEVGNKVDGFYGGITKIHKKDQIAKWEQLCPNCILE